ncbi:MAG: cytochrome c biogenesis protein CcdA [Oscillospiraceae bacterium]|nr:cytochrome c biogenesis protein CcdA [Oscillospiraceae bacterium]MDD4368381.1 cytochrome c biogenesis protein CcdA [Oscillospiraceae bacterium]
MSYILVFLEGILAFISPCILPMLPVYLIYLGGETNLATADTAAKARRLSFIRLRNTLAFISGFTLIYVALGATASALGQLIFHRKELLQRLSGALLILLGLYYLLDRPLFSPRAHAAASPDPSSRIIQAEGSWGWVKSLLFGMAFTLTWTPCLGTWVGAAMTQAASSQTMWHGILLLFLFSMGLGIPFFLTALLYNYLQNSLQLLKKYSRVIRIISALLLMVIGALMLFDIIGYYMALFN